MPTHPVSYGRHASTLAAVLCSAAAPHADADVAFPWPHAAAFGGGEYRLDDDNDVDAYRLPLSKRLRETPSERGHGPGIRLLAPVAAGTLSPLRDVLDDTDRVDAVSFMPGAELEFAAGERWTLRTRLQVGRAEDRRPPAVDDGSARIAAVGIRSRVAFPQAPGRPSLINGLLWSGYDAGGDERGALLKLTTGIELDIPVPGWRVRDEPMRLLPHVLVDHYRSPPERLALGNTSDGTENEWQVGLAAGREGGFKIWFLEFDAIGIALRSGERSNGLKFYVNSAF